MLTAAYYFPAWHVDPRCEQWHGKGWTEWRLLQAARPRFEAHRQPIVPDWGYFDEADPHWAARQIDLAADHRLDAFLFDWYWYDDQPFLERALTDGFLQAPNRHRMKFALMWANHDWLDIHPAGHSLPMQLRAGGAIAPDRWEPLCRRLIERFFTQPNHLTLDGKPYFSIYEIGSFLKSFGSIADARSAIDLLRARTVEAGLPGVHVNCVVWGLKVLPQETAVREPAALLSQLGIDSAASYVWVHDCDPRETFPTVSYDAMLQRMPSHWAHHADTLGLAYSPNVTMGWDPSPRTIQTDTYENRGYPFTGVVTGNSPARFEAALRAAFNFARARRSPMVTINAWNEWTEGSYLLPDTHNGPGYLQALARVADDCR